MRRQALNSPACLKPNIHLWKQVWTDFNEGVIAQTFFTTYNSEVQCANIIKNDNCAGFYFVFIDSGKSIGYQLIPLS
ncbi:MAG: hypothetical protein HS120_04985 [Burkholderiales bacterium]|nr:hypothetical protein [Burkholderiales bacterium]